MKNQLYELLKSFQKKYDFLPCPGCMSGLLKTTKQTINTSLKQLEKEGKIKITSDPRFKIKIKLIN